MGKETPYQRELRKRREYERERRSPESKKRKRVRDREHQREYRKSPEYKKEREVRHRRQKYGLSSEVYDEMVLAQGGRCLICRRKRKLCVDHDHESGMVRGLLCNNCNVGIGRLGDNPVLLKRAIDYLMEEGES